MRASVIDLGTNTFNMIVAETLPQGGYHIIAANRIMVKLGEGGIEKGYISYHAFNRGLDAMKEHAETIRNMGVDMVMAVATSATRSAVNGPDFVHMIEETTGIRVEVISGNREAELIYRGIKLAIPGDHRLLCMDIGGGSTEFIIGEGDRILWQQSTELGVSRLMGMFRPGDPYSSGDQVTMNHHFVDTLRDLRSAIARFPCTTLVGSSGSFETFSDIISMQRNGTRVPQGCLRFDFTVDEFNNVHQWLMQSTRQQRIDHPAIAPVRVDMIGAGSLLTYNVIGQTGISHMAMSAYALREGLIAEVLNKV
jgi:exopolyphosphatase/guanosine-5'-triphosphate,3'-diphosphate pyrophosphatase